MLATFGYETFKPKPENTAKWFGYRGNRVNLRTKFVFACFDVSLAIAMQNTLTFAAKQGVSYAITSQTQSGMNHDASIKSVVVANTMGMMPYLFPTTTGHSTDPNSYISITYYNPSTLALVTGTGSNRGGNT